MKACPSCMKKPCVGFLEGFQLYWNKSLPCNSCGVGVGFPVGYRIVFIGAISLYALMFVNAFLSTSDPDRQERMFFSLGEMIFNLFLLFLLGRFAAALKVVPLEGAAPLEAPTVATGFPAVPAPPPMAPPAAPLPRNENPEPPRKAPRRAGVFDDVR